MGSLGFSYDEEEHYTASASHSHQEVKALDPEEFRQQAHKMVDFIADYYSNIESYPVLSQVQPGYLRDQMPENPPQKPDSLEAIFRDIQAQIMPGMTHWLSPKFFAFFPATVSTAAFLGEMLCTGFNAVGFNWLSSPAVTELETTVMDWLANMLRLPSSFTFSGNGGGVMQGTTSEAVLVTLIAARDRALQGPAAGDIRRITVYCSDQTHTTFAKAAKLAGIHPRNVRTVPTSLADGFALSPARLREAISHDVDAGFVPLYLCATVGTTSTTAVDPLGPLADVAREYSMWVHVDAAYGGSACICPEFRHYLDGVERADSLSLSPHKWLLTYLDCCCLWVKRPDLLVNALSTNPEYLKNKQSESSSVVEYKDWQIGTGRRFKSLRLWLVLRSHGVENLQAHIRSDVRMAKRFEGMVRSDPRFEVVVPRTFALVCFRLLNPYPYSGSGYTEVLNRKMLELVNSSGKVYMTHTIVGGVYMLRFAVGATLTEDRHVTAAWRLIQYAADDVLKMGSYNSLSPPASSSSSSSSSTTSSSSCTDIIMEK